MTRFELGTVDGKAHRACNPLWQNDKEYLQGYLVGLRERRAELNQKGA